MNTDNTDEKYFNQIAANIQSTQVVKTKTAAKLLECHPSHVDTLCKRGELKKLDLGSHAKRITLQSIEEFLARASHGN